MAQGHGRRRCYLQAFGRFPAGTKDRQATRRIDRGRSRDDDGILNRLRGVAEEAPGAYKDLDAVVGAAEAAGLARKVARLSPLICIKG